MTNRSEYRARLTIPDYQNSKTSSRIPSDGDRAGLDTDMQAHIGRKLRHVYEPDLSASLPPELMSLLRELDDTTSGPPGS